MKKSFLFFLFILIFGINSKVCADTINNSNDEYCYYYSNGIAIKVPKKTYLLGNGKSAYIDKVGLQTPYGNWEDILNYKNKYDLGECDVSAYNPNGEECPGNIILLKYKNQYRVIADDRNKSAGAAECAKKEDAAVFSLTYSGMTGKQYNDLLFNNSSWNNPITIDGNATGCEIFGDVNDSATPSLAYMISQALNVMRIIVIILVIVLGTVDFAKAVIASKEDEMKKAQTTFIKRIIICVVIFLIPIFINIVMGLTDKYVEEFNIVDCNNE